MFSRCSTPLHVLLIIAIIIMIIIIENIYTWQPRQLDNCYKYGPCLNNIMISINLKIEFNTDALKSAARPTFIKIVKNLTSK